MFDALLCEYLSKAMSDRSEFLSEPGKPYAPADLQRQFQGMTPRDVYALLCKRQGCKCISGVLDLLPNRENGWEDISVLDLSRTYVGARGAQVVIELCKLLSCLKKITLADNYLDNQSAWMLSKMAVYHPSISWVDVSNNPISWVGGMSILELVTRNHMVQKILVCGTHINASIQEYIAIQTRRNTCIRDGHTRRGTNPCNHPIAMRQRALKRFFVDACSKLGIQNGKAPKSIVKEGVKEAYRLAGREEDLQQRPPDFVEGIVERAPSQEVGWDTFMLLCMCENAVIDAGVISKIRFIFEAFDIGSTGHVDAKDLQEMLNCMHDESLVTSEEVAMKKAYFDLGDNMTIVWDEFLLMMYDSNVRKGERLGAALESPLGTTGAVSSRALCR